MQSNKWNCYFCKGSEADEDGHILPCQTSKYVLSEMRMLATTNPDLGYS